MKKTDLFICHAAFLAILSVDVQATGKSPSHIFPLRGGSSSPQNQNLGLSRLFSPPKNDINAMSSENDQKTQKDILTDEEKQEEKSPKQEKETPSRGLFGRRKKKGGKNQGSKSSNRNETDTEKNKGDKDPASVDPSKETNTTTPGSAPSVIVLGAPSSPADYRVLRTAPPPPGIIRPGPDKSVLIADLTTALIRLATRIWWITWLARHFTENEKIRPVQRFVWERLNDRYTKDASVLQSVLSDPPFGVSKGRWKLLHNWRVLKNYEPQSIPLHKTFNRTVIVVSLASDKNGNLDLLFLRDVVSFLLQQFRARAFGVGKTDGKSLPLEVVLLVSSPGGSVSHYGLAAAQVRRLAQEEGMSLTVCVDNAAASGGYMVASQANKLIAAPFASLGSVGVIMEGLNFRELARTYGIQPIQIKSGKYKSTLSTFGSISQTDEKFETQRIARVHEAFQELVVSSRPALEGRKDILEGQVYLGSEALELDLVDEIMTSDEYIQNRVVEGDRVLKLHEAHGPKNQKRLSQISPLDLLPHLHTWISDRIGPENFGSFLLGVGPVIGFAAHILRQWRGSNPPTNAGDCYN